MKNLLTFLLLVLSSVCAYADYPEKPIRLVVPFSSGQSADVTARYLADRLKDKLGQQVIVDNRPGASGVVAAQAVLALPADGYTLMMQSLSIAIVPSITKVSFDVLNDFQPIARVAAASTVLIVGAKSPYQTLGEFIDGARRNPGKLSCATFGIGSPPHVALEMLMAAASVQMIHVPYRTSTITDVASGVLDCAIETPASALIHAKAKTGRALGVFSRTPASSVPGAAPIAATYPGIEIESWIGIFAKADVPAQIIRRIESALQEIVKEPAFEKFEAAQGLSTIQGDNAAVFARDLRESVQRFRAIVAERKIVAN